MPAPLAPTRATRSPGPDGEGDLLEGGALRLGIPEGEAPCGDGSPGEGADVLPSPWLLGTEVEVDEEVGDVQQPHGQEAHAVEDPDDTEPYLAQSEDHGGELPGRQPPFEDRPRRPADGGAQGRQAEGGQGPADCVVSAPLPVEEVGNPPVEVVPPSDQDRAEAEEAHLLGAVAAGERPLQVPAQPLRLGLFALQIEVVQVVDQAHQRRRQGDEDDGHEQERVPEPDDDGHRDRCQDSRDDGVDSLDNPAEEAGPGGLPGAAQEIVEVCPLEDLQAEGTGLGLELLQEAVLHLLLQPFEQDRPGPLPDAGHGKVHPRQQGQPREHVAGGNPALVHVDAAVKEHADDPDRSSRQQAGGELQR